MVRVRASAAILGAPAGILAALTDAITADGLSTTTTSAVNGTGERIFIERKS